MWPIFYIISTADLHNGWDVIAAGTDAGPVFES